MNTTPELDRLADSIASLTTSIADLIQTQIKAAICNKDWKQTDYVSEVVAERTKTIQNSERKLLCDIDQAAELLSVSPVSIRKLIRQNRLSRVPNFRRILIPYDELRKFAATGG